MNCPHCDDVEMVRMNRFGTEHIDQTKLRGTWTCPSCQYSEQR